jgi:ADP-ribose pyrophosphatase YjhB (NUDIX family)
MDREGRMDQDVTRSGDRWIPEDEYRAITSRVPILCVDVMPVTQVPSPAIGLILRETYAGGRGWCLVGGAVLHNEPLSEAIHRHVSSTLGGEASVRSSTLQFVDIVEYFSKPDIGEFYDPRKHAVALTYCAELEGPVVPEGEAMEFRWFPIGQLPDGELFGFGQDRVVERLLRRLNGAQS